MKYNFKLLFSPVKLVIGLVFVVLIPIALYVPTYFDFVNDSSFFLPFIGIVLFADLCLLDKNNQADEIVYLINKRPVNIFIERYTISVLFLLFYTVFMNIVYRGVQRIQGPIRYEPISASEYIVIVMGSSLFIATIAMTASAVFGNVYVGYSFACIYWIYWNINCQKEMILNPFSFIANPACYEKPLIKVYGIIIILILVNCFLCTKSPFFCADKIRRITIRRKMKS